MKLTGELKEKSESKNKTKMLNNIADIELSDDDLNNVSGGFSNLEECSKGGAYDINDSGIL